MTRGRPGRDDREGTLSTVVIDVFHQMTISVLRGFEMSLLFLPCLLFQSFPAFAIPGIFFPSFTADSSVFPDFPVCHSRLDWESQCGWMPDQVGHDG